MKKLLLFVIFFLNLSILLMAQKSISLDKEIKDLTDGTYQLIEKNKKGDTLIIGTLSSIKPEVKNGEFRFYDQNRILEAKGFYTNNIPSGLWYYYDYQGNTTRTINYDKTIEFLKADTIRPKNVFLVVERMPYFNKDEPNQSFRNYIKENMVYPIYAAKKNISGRIFLYFIITKSGKLSNLSVIRTSGDIDLNMEALRLVSESPLWEPGFQGKDTVAVSYTFPITFVQD